MGDHHGLIGVIDLVESPVPADADAADIRGAERRRLGWSWFVREVIDSLDQAAQPLGVVGEKPAVSGDCRRFPDDRAAGEPWSVIMIRSPP